VCRHGTQATRLSRDAPDEEDDEGGIGEVRASPNMRTGLETVFLFPSPEGSRPPWTRQKLLDFRIHNLAVTASVFNPRAVTDALLQCAVTEQWWDSFP
jgi:hypothetical protein